MKKAYTSVVAFTLVLVLIACSSNQFHVILTMTETGFDYVAIVSGHPETQPQIKAAFAVTSSVYDAWVAGTTTVDKVEAAVQALGDQLTSLLGTFGVVSPNTLALAKLTINEVLALVKLLPLATKASLHSAMKMPSAAVAKATSPNFLTPAEYKATFNLAAGAKVIK